MLVGGGQRERDLLGRERLKQPTGDQPVDHGRLHLPAAGRVDVIGARVPALVVAALAAVKRGHRPAARTAPHDPLAQRVTLPRRALALARVVLRQPLLVGQELLPADVPLVVVVDHDRPLGARQLDHAGGDDAVGPHQAAVAVAPEHVGPGV